MRILDQIQLFNFNKQENDDEIDEPASMKDFIVLLGIIVCKKNLYFSNNISIFVHAKNVVLFVI